MWGFLVVWFSLIQIHNYSCCKTLLFKDVLKSPVSFSLSLLKKRKMKALNHKNTEVYLNLDTFLAKVHTVLRVTVNANTHLLRTAVHFHFLGVLSSWPRLLAASGQSLDSEKQHKATNKPKVVNS